MGTMQAEGYFPRQRSMLRRVHEERLVGLFYGQRALCVGALAPLNYVGTVEHSYARQTPFRRLVHTAEAFEQIYFGTRAQADRVLATVQRLHRRVAGTLASDTGPFSAGTPYSALDPELMLWTLAVIADSAQCFYELFIRTLSASEREALWQDYRRFGELFGLQRSDTPASYCEFRRWWEAKLAGEEMYLTEEARYVGYATAFEIPLPCLQQPAKRVHDLIMLGSLPERARELYGLRFGRAEQAAFAAVTSAVRAARPLMPAALASGWNTSSFELVAQTERRRIERGRWTPQVLPEGPRALPARRRSARARLEHHLAGRAPALDQRQRLAGALEREAGADDRRHVP
jgi:uncharacterized protein (DUF2236 family)